MSILPYREITRPRVNEVFTPRRTDVNHEIYVDRIDLERALKRALAGSLHAIVFGESGSGKSWLYKKVLGDIGAEFATANCANASRLGTITEEIKYVVTEHVPKKLQEYSEEMNAGVKAVFAEGGLKSSRKYSFSEVDPFLDCVQILRDKADARPAVLVVDNLEMIFDTPATMKELADLIILLDDERYARFDVKLLIVGVPRDAKKYLASSLPSVGNRLTEIPEVSSLSLAQVKTLVETGFVKLLKVTITSEHLAKLKDHVYSITLGYAQAVQEYCEQLAYAVEDSEWILTDTEVDVADRAWLQQGLSQASGLIDQWMNKRETKAGRRNQVLWVLSRMEKRVFHVNDVEQSLRLEFASSTNPQQSLAIDQILSEMSKGKHAILKKSETSDASYEFRDARVAMALKTALLKDVRQKISKIGSTMI